MTAGYKCPSICFWLISLMSVFHLINPVLNTFSGCMILSCKCAFYVNYWRIKKRNFIGFLSACFLSSKVRVTLWAQISKQEPFLYVPSSSIYLFSWNLAHMVTFVAGCALDHSLCLIQHENRHRITYQTCSIYKSGYEIRKSISSIF